MSTENKSERKSDEKTKVQFNEGEQILCYHGPLLYEAKCVKIDLKNKTPQYLIHYSGWNKSWDEWIESKRICKLNEENTKKQHELLKTHGTKQILTKIKANAKKSVSNMTAANLAAHENDKNNADGKKKRPKQQEESSELSDSYSIKNEIKISVPDDLKKKLATDFHNINSLNKIVNLPASNTIDMILNDYVAFKLGQQFEKDVIVEVVEGIKYYFNSVLSTKLLVNSFERQQNLELFKNSTKKPSEVYGCQHLLRLFVVIGDLLSYTVWDEICIKQLDLYLADVVKYIEQKSESLFPATYIDSSLLKATEKATGNDTKKGIQ